MQSAGAFIKNCQHVGVTNGDPPPRSSQDPFKQGWGNSREERLVWELIGGFKQKGHRISK